MNSNNKPASGNTPENVGEQKVECQICLAEIPASSAKSEESADYVAHFCGLECYEKWREGQVDES